MTADSPSDFIMPRRFVSIVHDMFRTPINILGKMFSISGISFWLARDLECMKPLNLNYIVTRGMFTVDVYWCAYLEGTSALRFAGKRRLATGKGATGSNCSKFEIGGVKKVYDACSTLIILLCVIFQSARGPCRQTHRNPPNAAVTNIHGPKHPLGLHWLFRT